MTMRFYNYLKDKILTLYIYNTFYTLRLCAYLEKCNSIVFMHFSRKKIVFGILAVILLNIMNACIIIVYYLLMHIILIFFTSNNLKKFLIKLFTIVFFIFINYILSYYNILLYYKIWR